jgi:hypothetical protein
MSRVRGIVVVLALLGIDLGTASGIASAEAPRSAIVDGAAVLQQSPVEIEASLGQPVRSRAVPPGDFRLPEGGTWRVYRERGLRIDVDFERERSTMVMIEFPDRAIAPRTFEEALEAVNLPSSPAPDRVTRDSREWHNLKGYFVRLIAAYPTLDRIDTIILSVQPLP